MAEDKPPVEVALAWDGGLRFRGRAGEGPPVVLDSDGQAGPSPVQVLAYCSVWHSLRPDIAFTTSFEVRPQ